MQHHKEENSLWIKVADSLEEVTARATRTVMPLEIRGRRLCLVYHNSELYCTSASCPHAGGNLCHGFIDKRNNIVCSDHGYRFSLRNGSNTSGEGYHLKTYPVRLQDDGIYVSFPDRLL